MAEFSELTRYLECLTQDGIASGACLIYLKNREVYRHYAGWGNVKNQTPLRDDTLYRLYSLTKLYTAVAVFTLVEKGLMEVDDMVSRFLPEFEQMHVLRTRANGLPEIVSSQRPLTIRHLLTMQSGISYPYDSGGAAIWKTREIVEAFRKKRKNYTTREYASMLSDVPLAFQPGSHFLYGAGYDVLAAAVEVVAGMRYGDYVKRAILEPLELEETRFKIENPEILERLAGIYRYDGKRRWFEEVPEKNQQYCLEFLFEEGGGGLLATVDDCMKFMLMLQRGGVGMNGKRILKEDMVQYMTNNQLDDENKQRDFAAQFGESESGGALSDYGYGCGCRVRMRKTGEADSPLGEFGWYGMSGSYVLVDPDNQLTVVYLQQMIPGREREIHPELRRLIYKTVFPS